MNIVYKFNDSLFLIVIVYEFKDSLFMIGIIYEFKDSLLMIGMVWDCFIIISCATWGCWLHYCWECSCAADAVPSIPSMLVLILSTLEGWQADSTHLVLFNNMTGAQTQDAKTLNQPP